MFNPHSFQRYCRSDRTHPLAQSRESEETEARQGLDNWPNRQASALLQRLGGLQACTAPRRGPGSRTRSLNSSHLCADCQPNRDVTRWTRLKALHRPGQAVRCTTSFLQRYMDLLASLMASLMLLKHPPARKGFTRRADCSEDSVINSGHGREGTRQGAKRR